MSSNTFIYRFNSQKLDITKESNMCGPGVIGGIIGLIVHSAMVGVGASYTEGLDADSDCKLQAVWFLKVAGGFLLTLDILEILVNCIGERDNEEDPKGPVCGLVNIVGCFVIFIWGSVIIFGPYQDWTYNGEDKASNHYCAYTPYMFSFVVLILGWVGTAVRVVVSSLVICRMCCN